MDDCQLDIDRLIEQVHEGAPPDRGEFGDDTSARCDLVQEKGSEILVLGEAIPESWHANFTDLIADDLDEDRIEALRAGAKLNDEEEELWAEVIERVEYGGMTTISIHRVKHSLRPELRAYVAWHSAESGQMGDLLGWYGPVQNARELNPFVIEQSREWPVVGWEVDPYSDIVFIETPLDLEEFGERLDGADHAQAEEVFKAVKAVRVEQARKRGLLS